MELVRKLLLDIDKTIVEAAYECGYDYASRSLTNALERSHGISSKWVQAERN